MVVGLEQQNEWNGKSRSVAAKVQWKQLKGQFIKEDKTQLNSDQVLAITKGALNLFSPE